MLNNIKEKNRSYVIHSVFDDEFKTYGKLHELSGYEELRASMMLRYPIVSTGTMYKGDDEPLQEFDLIKKIKKEIYGELEIQAGPCQGHNQVLNGIEYHQGSEVAVCLTDCVFVLGHIWDMDGTSYDGDKCAVFYAPAGSVVETYSTTLHYTPISVSDEGFFTVCVLLKHTGDKTDRSNSLKKVNKWFVAHPDNLAKVQEGDVIGLNGKMIEINY